MLDFRDLRRAFVFWLSDYRWFSSYFTVPIVDMGTWGTSSLPGEGEEE